MDREDLLALLRELEDGELSVRLNGDIVSDGGEWTPADVDEAVAELTADLANLARWAKLAPNYMPPAETNESGDLVDSEGIPY